MPTTILNNRYYKIKAKHSNKYLEPRSRKEIPILRVPIYSDTQGQSYELMVQCTEKTSTNAQQFIIIPADENYFFIMTKSAPLVLDVEGAYDYLSNLTNTKRLITYEFNGGQNQQFRFLDAGDGYVYIQPKGTDEVLDVEGNSQSDNAHIVRYRKQDSNNQKFLLEAADEITLPPKNNSQFDPILPRSMIPRIDSYDCDIPITTKPVLIGETYIPCIFVKDTERTPTQKALESPYYILKREQFWKSIQRDKHNDEEETYEIETGYTQETKVAIQTTLGLDVKPGLGLQYKAINIALNATANAELKMSLSLEKTVREKQTKTIKFYFSKDKRIKLNIWTLVDRFTLLRSDRSLAYSWDVNVDIDGLTDRYEGGEASAILKIKNRFIALRCPFTVFEMAGKPTLCQIMTNNTDGSGVYEIDRVLQELLKISDAVIGENGSDEVLKALHQAGTFSPEGNRPA